MREFITDRTQAEVVRCKELAAKGWNNMTEAEKAEWYGTAMRGAYNYSDLNRVESAVAELSEFLELGLATKTNWGVWDAPTQADMSRYISNLQTIKDRYLSSVQIPAAMNSLNYESANNIEKMLIEAYANKDTHAVWQKSNATVEYVWEYTRHYDHDKIGTKGVSYGYSWVDGSVPAVSTVKFTTSDGFVGADYDDYVSASRAVGMYDTLYDPTTMIKIISEPYFDGDSQEFNFDGQIYIGYSYVYEYEIVGYATREKVPDCSIGSFLSGVLVPQGELPGGELIKGSLAEGCCYVQEADGKYYYYELR